MFRLGHESTRDSTGAAESERDARLYGRGKLRVEAHLARCGDGRIAVIAFPLDGRRPRRFAVDALRPWTDFERQAGLRHARWGPCRGGSAGL
jgi:hypothetical protein